ncbi:MAG: DUF3530 family protein [Pseudomonadales bacterium]|nr:DUF3530 family protein [Pseudomonadales bacterium]
MLFIKKSNIVVISIFIVIIFGFNGDDAWAKKKKKNKKEEPKAVIAAPIILPLKLTPELIEKQRSEALSNDLTDGTTSHWLPDQDNKQFLVLCLDSIALMPKGTLLLLPENEHHPDWPGIIHYLRTDMPDEGWSTVSLALPDYLPQTKIPPRPKIVAVVSSKQSEDAKDKKSKRKKKRKKKEDTAKKEAKKQQSVPPVEAEAEAEPEQPFEERTHNRISEALNFIESRNSPAGKIVVVAEGLSALWINHFLAANPAQTTAIKSKIDAVIFIGGRDTPKFNHLGLNRSAVNIDRPFLDITNINDKSYAQVNRRSKLAKQAGRSQYQRLVLSSPLHFRGQQSQLYSRIKGWLKRHFETKKSRPM